MMRTRSRLLSLAVAAAVAAGGVTVTETVAPAPTAQAQLVPPGGLPAALPQIFVVILLAAIPTVAILYTKYSDPDFVPQNASDERGVEWAANLSTSIEQTGEAALEYARQEQLKQQQQQRQQ